MDPCARARARVVARSERVDGKIPFAGVWAGFSMCRSSPLTANLGVTPRRFAQVQSRREGGAEYLPILSPFSHSLHIRLQSNTRGSRP